MKNFISFAILKQMDENFSEKTVLISLQGGSQEAEKAMDQVFDFFHSRLCLYAINFVKDPESAKDVVADVFMKLWWGRQTLKIEKLNAYLYKSTHNTALDFLKKEKNREKRDQEYAGLSDADILNGYEKDTWLYANSILEIYKALEMLPPQARQVIEFVMDGLDNDEISQKMQISPFTVRNYKLRGILLLRKHLSPGQLLLLFSLLLRRF